MAPKNHVAPKQTPAAAPSQAGKAPKPAAAKPAAAKPAAAKPAAAKPKAAKKEVEEDDGHEDEDEDEDDLEDHSKYGSGRLGMLAKAASKAAAVKAGKSTKTMSAASASTTTTAVTKKSTEALSPAVLLRRKQKTLLLSSRGITARSRHLFKDLHKLLPHCKKESKLDTKSRLNLINEIAEMDNATNAIFFEARKRQDLYMWFAKTPSGPSMKTYVQNIHTMAELNMTGNCLRASRPLLSFDKTFDSQPHWQLVKEMFVQILGTPQFHPKSKPFYDHLFSFSVADDKVWFRCYQITETTNDAGVKEPALVEIGPRFVLTVVRIFAGSFGGPTLYENEKYVSPNDTRRQIKRLKSTNYARREKAEADRDERKQTHVLPANPLDDVFAQ